MIKKFLIYCKSDGVIQALTFTFKTLVSKVFSNSTTVFLEYNNSGTVRHSISDRINIKRLTLSDVNRLDFARLKELDYRKWLQNRSRLYVGYIGNTPISYTWTHFNTYTIHGLCEFKLGQNECWIGPTYVTKANRNKGIASYMISYIQNHVFPSEVIQTYYTSINKTNASSISSVVKSGFELLGSIMVARHRLSKIIDNNNIINEHFSFKI